MTVLERFSSKVERGAPEECWPWRASADAAGYGKFSIGGVTYHAHRVAYELFVGPIPEGLTIDHLCSTPRCVNPWHLEVVTMRENLRRGSSPAGLNARKTHCPKGHPYSHVNNRGERQCRTCMRETWQRYDARKRAA